MDGSMPLAVYRLKNTNVQRELIRSFIIKLTNDGWKWFKDIYVEWESDTIEIQIYREEIISLVKEFIVEELI